MKHSHIFELPMNIDGVPSVDFMAVHGMLPVGNIVVRRAGEVSQMARLYVAPGWRRNGIATALFTKALAASQGTRCMSWTVNKNNEAAIAFYRKQGAGIFNDDGQDYWMSVPVKEEA